MSKMCVASNVGITTDWLQSKWGFVLDESPYGDFWELHLEDRLPPPTLYLHNGEWLFTADSVDGRICVEEKVITNQEQLCDLMKVLEIKSKE